LDPQGFGIGREGDGESVGKGRVGFEEGDEVGDGFGGGDGVLFIWGEVVAKAGSVEGGVDIESGFDGEEGCV